MQSFWLLLFIALVIFILGFTVWSYWVSLRQKKTWRTYAEENQLTFQATGLLGSGAVQGEVNGRPVSLFTDSQPTDDMRGQRYVSVIEVGMGSGLPIGTGIGTKHFHEFLNNLNLPQTMKPTEDVARFADWKSDAYLIRTKSTKALKPYLTEERFEALSKIFSMRHTGALFFFDHMDSVLRIETTDPLIDPTKIRNIIQKITKLSAPLALKKGEIYEHISPPEEQRQEQEQEQEQESADDNTMSDTSEKAEDKTKESMKQPSSSAKKSKKQKK